MNWHPHETLPWASPLACARQLPGDIALLYSGLSEAHSGRYSFLLAHPLQTVEGEDGAALPPASGTALPDWVGYLGYGLREPKHTGKSPPIRFPGFRFIRYGALWRFDHVQQCIETFTRSNNGTMPQRFVETEAHSGGAHVTALTSNLTRESYEAAVNRTVAAIHAGAFYQANLTRKFWGTFADAPDAATLFAMLCAASPAPYSAFIRHGGQAILSSSPECFLTIEANGRITTRPIKGSARRGATASADETVRAALTASEKNHAENLMITDLMRNDLSRVCEPGSVEVAEQSGLYSYATIHHLISTVIGQKRADTTIPDVLRACFPPGSMTGAPKIAAMRWCEQEEQIERGVYSGAIGWMNAQACDFSVVIRTILLEGARFEFQVGGGIVADSTPADEWRETIAKARGICAALGIEEHKLAAL